MLKELKKQHEVTYLTMDDGSAGEDAHEQAAEYCQTLITLPFSQREKFSAGFYTELGANLFSSLPYAIKKYRSPTMTSEIAKRTERQQHDIVVCDFLAPAVNMPCKVDCATLLFEHNVEAAIWRRHFQVQNNPVKKLYLWNQWRKMRAFEQEMGRRFDCIVAVSAADAAQLVDNYDLPRVFDVPTGVDTEYFSSDKVGGVAGRNLVFTGSMDWLPNQDAMFFFAEKIFPLIQNVVPDVTLTVVGRNPSADLLKLGDSNNAIIVTGRVPDVRPYIESGAVYVVPLRIGGGTRLKIYEAMSMGKAVVSTTVGAEGLPLDPETEIILADTPTTFANAVVRLLQHPNVATQLGMNAAAKVRTQFGWANVARRFSDICEDALARRLNEIGVARKYKQAKEQYEN
jgi:glycosyltransferase involved in cell wall biosynthesis